VRLIDSRVRRLRVGGAVFASVLSDSNDLRRHFRTIGDSRTLWRRRPIARNGFISLGETAGFATRSQAAEIIRGREIGHFAGLFVFNDLTPISFRANRESRRGADETREPVVYF
jgi:hypothetical protein